MQKIKNLILFYCLILIIPIFIQACCNGNIKIIGSRSMSVVDSTFLEIDTIKGEFDLLLELSSEVVSVGLNPFLNAAYATSCDYDLENMIVEESIKLSCDKAFSFSNEMVEANSNFINLAGLKINNSSLDEWVTVVINFETDFIQNVDFSNEVYLFKLEMETDDGVLISHSASAYIDL